MAAVTVKLTLKKVFQDLDMHNVNYALKSVLKWVATVILEFKKEKLIGIDTAQVYQISIIKYDDKHQMKK